ncbi:MAG: RNA methyltransferase [Candidatus Caenarcaniphilales bacterium]|nr:RNA methyltransferase [Candidatus Caenarcaniphilales bacterium]
MEKPANSPQTIIQSKGNQWFKLITSIKEGKKERDKYFIAEGEKHILSFLKKFVPFAFFSYEDESPLPQPPHLDRQGGSLSLFPLSRGLEGDKLAEKAYIFSKKLWKELSDVETPQRLIAIFERPEQKNENIEKTDSVLILDRIQDPGNLGTIIRTAIASGWKDIICLKGTVDPYSPKVVRASAGALALANIYCKISLEELIPILQNNSFEIFTTSSHNSVAANEYNFKETKKPCLILGNEGGGIESNWIEKLRTERKIVDLKIPMENEEVVESLNVAIAGALLMFRIKGLV